MTRNKLQIILIIVLFAVNLVLVGFMVFRPNHHKKRIDVREFVLDKLEFDDSQIENYDKLIQQHKTDIRAADASIKKARVGLFLLLQNDEIGALDSILDEIAQLSRGIEITNFNHFKDVKDLCSENQLDNFNALMVELPGVFMVKPPH